MSIVVRQAAGTLAQSGSPSYSFGSLPIAGNAIIIAVYAIGTTVTCTGVSDNQGVGNTYTRINFKQDGTDLVEVSFWWCQSIGATSGTFTATATLTGTPSAGNVAAGGMECSGIGALDQTGTGGPATNTVTATATGANTSSGDLVIGGGGGSAFNPGAGYPPTSGYTNWFGIQTASYVSFGYKLPGATETSAATLTWGTGNSAVVLVATFFPRQFKFRSNCMVERMNAAQLWEERNGKA